jgi:hypothetical protein
VRSRAAVARLFVQIKAVDHVRKFSQPRSIKGNSNRLRKALEIIDPGVMECWSIGVLKKDIQLLAILQYASLSFASEIRKFFLKRPI